jgi:hypothetical protein
MTAVGVVCVLDYVSFSVSVLLGFVFCVFFISIWIVGDVMKI